MNFNIQKFKAIIEGIEQNHSSWFSSQSMNGKPVSIHSCYYVYYNSKTHLLRFTLNNDLPASIKEEIKASFEAYQKETEGGLEKP
jgi:hypothetical protein